MLFQEFLKFYYTGKKRFSKLRMSSGLLRYIPVLNVQKLLQFQMVQIGGLYGEPPFPHQLIP
jgi:hypothetical protein